MTHASDNPGTLKTVTNFQYESLPDAFHVRLEPVEFPNVQTFVVNRKLAMELGLEPEWLCSSAGLKWLSGGGSPSIAMAYSGHQFGHFSPVLGDGRARLINERHSPDGKLRDVHLKGSGATPFSRGGDGKATLGSAVREYILSEAMAGLGVSTTRSLAIVTTGELIPRDGGLFPGAVLARTANSHIRVGTFQYASTFIDLDQVRELADFSLKRSFPGAPDDGENRYRYFLKEVSKHQAKLIAQWMSLGFIHGVMNTDNMAISGETIDYGPCAFIDRFRPDKVFSSIDRRGRYAWNRQHVIGQWNLARFAETLLPLLAADEEQQIQFAEQVLQDFVHEYEAAYRQRFAMKLGLPLDDERVGEVIDKTLSALFEGGCDFTHFFNALTRHVEGGDKNEVIGVFSDANVGQAWYDQWQSFTNGPACVTETALQDMRSVNPVRIPRNHLVARAIKGAESGSTELMNMMVTALASPFREDNRFIEFEAAPNSDEIVEETFCGT